MSVPRPSRTPPPAGARQLLRPPVAAPPAGARQLLRPPAAGARQLLRPPVRPTSHPSHPRLAPRLPSVVAEQLLAEVEEEAVGGEPVDDTLAEEDPAEIDEAAGEAEEEVLANNEDGVQDHLKDALDGNLRLKRLLSRDGVGEPANKRGKLNNREVVDSQRPIVQVKIKQLLMHWQVPNDLVLEHVLEGLSLEELKWLIDTNYWPNYMHARKTASELLHFHVVHDFRDKKLGPVGGGHLDAFSAFKQRWKIDLLSEKKLRNLKYKDLMYVMKEFNGEIPLDKLIAQAANTMPDEENAENVVLDVPGLKGLPRFNRLELIDPLADAAVFGDANLTFSKILASHRKALGHLGRVIATTFEEIETLRERYPEIDKSIAYLEKRSAEVYHGVDCTRIAVDERFAGMEGSIGAVYYNFPHSGAIKGFFDGNPLVNWRHENLMRLFFRALRFFVKPGGIVKVASNATATGVRFSYIVGGATENEFLHTESMPFTEWCLHRYGRSYGDSRDTYKRPDAVKNESYNSQSGNTDTVYCFRYAPTGKKMGKQQIAIPPTLKTLSACVDGPFKNLSVPARMSLAKQLHERFMKEISGTHVG